VVGVKEKGISSIVVFLLLLCAVLSALFVPSARSDGVVYDNLFSDTVLWMSSENVTIDASPNTHGYIAKVRGVYPFHLWSIADTENLENLMERARSEMAMIFPVPPNSENISVKIFGENIEWVWTDDNYPTELGNFPIFKWKFRIPENMIKTWISGTWGGVYSDTFNVVVEYAYQLPLENRRYVLLYSLGAAGSLAPYNYLEGGASAYIETKLAKEVENIGVRLTKYENYPFDSSTNIDNENNRVTTMCWLGRGTGDYVVEFTTPVPAAPSGGVSPLAYVGVAVVIVVIIAAVLILKPF